MSARTPWFRSWFGREYLAVYPHRDRAEARRAVGLLCRSARPAPGSRVLDLACGGGRHLVEMERIGLRTTGLDLSQAMLDAARSTARSSGAPPAPQTQGDGSRNQGAAEAPARLVQGDMRSLPFRPGAFDVVTSYFTSFGYFDDEEDDARVLREVRRVLKPGGRFLLDFLNADHTIANLPRSDRRHTGKAEVLQERRLIQDGRVVEKRIAIADPEGTRAREFVERVRLYRRQELEDAMNRAGLESEAVCGDYDSSPFSPASPRCIVLARAAS